jgi:hypothetical protein
LDQPQAPANWYQDPSDPEKERYWDGTTWTGHKRTTPARQPAAPAPRQPRPLTSTPSSAEVRSSPGGVPASAAPPRPTGPVWAPENGRQLGMGTTSSQPVVGTASGYMPAIEVKPGITHSAILAGISLMLTFAVPFFFISLVLGGAATWTATNAGKANNQGDLAAAYSKARVAGKLRVATYASWVVIGILAMIIMALGVAMLMDPGYY